MTVLVMGATGNIGGAIVHALRERELGSRPSAGMVLSGRPGSRDSSRIRTTPKDSSPPPLVSTASS